LPARAYSWPVAGPPPIVAETPLRLLALFDQSFRSLNRQHPEFAELVRSRSRGRFTRPAAV
jgi:hypothetical protein